MKRMSSTLAAFAMFAGICSNSSAAELLDVKPVLAGNVVTVEISADIPMTYTYYNIPGQPRAVVDIADADPEKVEPLIVVNKGVISSISVDKAQISDMVVSRIVFNLESQSEIAVAATPDRKTLMVTFAGSSPTATTQVITQKTVVETTSPGERTIPPGQRTTVSIGTPVETPQKTASVPPEEDPLGLEESAPAPRSDQPPATGAIPSTAATPALPAPAAKRLEPVVPDIPGSSTLFVRKIVPGDSYIEIQTSAAVSTYKVVKLSQPERLAIDIPSAKSSLESKTVPINRLGIAKVRIGINPDYTRIVLDAAKADFPKYTITRSRAGLRINFN